MDKGKRWVVLAGLALAMISLGWGTDEQQRPQTKRPEQARQVDQARQVERNVTYKCRNRRRCRA